VRIDAQRNGDVVNLGVGEQSVGFDLQFCTRRAAGMACLLVAAISEPPAESPRPGRVRSH
jgi:hypothetical protein